MTDQEKKRGTLALATAEVKNGEPITKTAQKYKLTNDELRGACLVLGIEWKKAGTPSPKVGDRRLSKTKGKTYQLPTSFLGFPKKLEIEHGLDSRGLPILIVRDAANSVDMIKTATAPGVHTGSNVEAYVSNPPNGQYAPLVIQPVI